MTAAELIEGALRKIGVMDAGESVSAATKVIGLTALNRLLSAWGNEPNISTLVTDTKTITTNTPTLTIGPSGSIVTTRPLQVIDAYYTSNSVDYPLQRISMTDYYAISDKTTAGIPTRYAFDPQATDSALYFYSPPENGTITIISRKPLEQYTDVTDTVTLPIEYHAAIEWNLAAMLCPEFGQEVGATVLSMSQSTYYGLKSLNTQPVPMAQTTPFQSSRFGWI